MAPRLLPLLAALVVAFLPTTAALSADPAEPSVRVLVYSATYGFRHGSISTGVNQFRALDETPEFEVAFTEDPGRISAHGLAGFDVVVFLNTTGEHPFSEQQRREFLDWLGQGNGVAGMHAAADGNYYWSDYGHVIGAYFLAHPHTGTATNDVEEADHPIVAHLPARFGLNEEYYRFQLDPRDNVRVLTSLDRSTAGTTGPTYVEAQPTTWCHEVGGGRSFYTAWGHFDASFTNPDVWQTMVQGMRWAAGRVDADCSPTVEVPAGRLPAETADQIALARKGTSTEKGAAQVVTGILNRGHVLFRDVDLTGVTEIAARVSVETAPLPRPYHLPVPEPAVGGTIHVRLGSAAKNTPDLVTIPVGRGLPEWRTLTVPISGVEGVHDLYFVFSEQVATAIEASRIVVPELTDSWYLLSVDWFELRRGDAS